MATMATIQERASARFRFEALGSKRSADDSDDDEDPSELERSAIKFDLFPKILAPLKEFAQRHLDSATLSKFGLAGSTTDDLSQTDPGSLTARRKQGMDDLLAILRVVAEVEELDPGELIATKASTASGNDSVFAVLSGALVSEDAGTGADATLYRPGALLQEECFLLGAAPEASLRAVGGMLLEAALAKKNTHWAVGADRWAQLFKDLDDAGFDASPIDKPRDKAMPEASARLRAGCLQLLTPVQRTIKLTDVIHDGDLEDGDTHTWHDKLKGHILMRGERGMDALAHYMALTPGRFNAGGRASEPR